MIHFNYPWALLGLLSVPILLVLHSLRPSRRTVLVSSNALWWEALGVQRRGLGLEKLLRNLSLLLLLLFALLASLGLAGPEWVTATADQGDAVVILDTSASMQVRAGGTTRFQLAKREAADLIDALPENRRMLILSSARNTLLRSAFESDKRILHEALDALEVTDEAGRPRAALALALSLLRNRERGRVYFLTDGAFDERLDFVGTNVEFRLLGGPERNVAITRFDIRPEVETDGRFQVLLTVRNYADIMLSTRATVSLDGSTLIERVLELAPESARTLVVPFRGSAAGRSEVAIEIDDGLAVDNRAFAVIGDDEVLRILLLSPGSFYLESALRALPNAIVIRRDATPVEFVEEELRHFDVIVVDRLALPKLPSAAYFLVDSVPPGLPFTEAGTIQHPVIEGRGASALLRQVDLTGVRIDEARRIAIDEGAGNLQRLFWSAETPLALAGIHGELRFVYLGFDPAESSFPLQAAFPLFVRQSIAWLRPRGRRSSPTQIAAGEPYTIQVPVGLSNVIVRSPTSEASVREADRGSVVVDDTSRTGIYQYTLSYEHGAVHRHFAVNLTDERESDINHRSLLRSASQAEGEFGHQARVAVGLWPYLTGVSLLVLTLEACLHLVGLRRA